MFSARPLVFYVYTVLWSDPGRPKQVSDWPASIHASLMRTMAKNKQADNQFAIREKYLARLIVARWASLPTIGPVEYGLTIQIKFSVLCTNPQVGNPVFCGREAVIYIVVRMDAANPTQVNINRTAQTFLDDLGIAWQQYPNNGLSLRHNETTIVCEFGQCDPVNRYQSIIKWERTTDTIAQHLITSAMTTGTRSQIVELEFPKERVVKRGKTNVTLRSVRDWHVLKLLSVNNHYKGTDLIEHAWTITGKTSPTEIMPTVYDVIRRLREKIRSLQIDIVNDQNGNYSLEDIRPNQTCSHRSSD